MNTLAKLTEAQKLAQILRKAAGETVIVTDDDRGFYKIDYPEIRNSAFYIGATQQHRIRCIGVNFTLRNWTGILFKDEVEEFIAANENFLEA